MTLPENVTIPDGVVSQPLGEDVVLLHLHTGVYWSLNPSGAVIWQEVQGHGDPRKAAEALCRKFTVSQAQAQQAVSELLRDLAKEGLVELAP